MRRRGKVFEAIEKFSVIKTLQAIEDAQRRRAAARRARHGITEQDAHLAGHILEAGPRARGRRSTSGTRVDAEQRDEVKRDLERKLGFLAFADASLHLGARGHAASARC